MSILKTLKGRLYLLAALVVLPTYIFIYLSFDYSRGIVRDELLDAARLVSRQAVNNQEQLVNSTEEFITSLSQMSQIRHPNSEACRRFVSDITPILGRFINIGVPNKDGILTCSGIQLTKKINLNDRDYINEAMTSKRFSSSGVQMDRVFGYPTINFAYPVMENDVNDEVVGVAVVVMSLQWWNTLLSSQGLPNGSVAFILDDKENAVAGFPENAKYEQPDNYETIWTGSDGVNRAFIKRQVNDSNGKHLLTFVTGVAVDESLKSVNDRHTAIVIIFSIMVVIVLALLNLFFMRAISQPLNTLSHLAIRLGQKKSINKIESTGVEEMDHLQDSFIEMAAHIEQAEKRMVLQAHIDRLTGISNRDAFNRELSSALQRVSEKSARLGIILLDLDDFKEINDTRSHEVGDEVLKTLAARLMRNMPSAQYISRMGGDEFILLFEGNEIDETVIFTLCGDIQNIINEPFNVLHGEVNVTASIGAALYPEDGKNARELMGAADQAMYHAKQCGRNTARRFNWGLKDALIEKMELIKDLRSAIENREFHLLYQPIINKEGKVIKFEALIRWVHPQKGLISPDQFIPFAEESGQIITIGNWVIKEAKKAIKSIHKVHGKHVQVSVNVSPIQLSKQQGQHNQLLSELLSQDQESSDENHEHKQNSLVVEITENLLMNSDENTRNALLAFREEGIQVALDDFGTGYSSLAYIMNYDIDYLKIDQSFVQKLGESTASQTLCETMISMAHALGVSVIAEGVETKEQARILMQSHCDYLQGYYFSKPIPLDEVLSYEQNKPF